MIVGLLLVGAQSARATPIFHHLHLLPDVASSAIRVRLVPFASLPPSGPDPMRTELQGIYSARDGSRELYAVDARGLVWRINPKGEVSKTPFLDVRHVRGAAFFCQHSRTGPVQTGLRGLAFHSDFARPGAPGHGRLYTIDSETVGPAAPGAKKFDSPYMPNHDYVLAEWTVRSGDRTRVDPASRRELLRIPAFAFDHGADQLAFDPNLEPGDRGYGDLFIGVGDGGVNFEHVDRYDSAQNPGRVLGKILRIDPLPQVDGRAYGVPRDNPFLGRSEYLPEIYAMGLRHPETFAFEVGGARRLLIADMGEAQIEEIDVGRPGANYGWPAREGTFAVQRGDVNVALPLPSDDAASGYSYPAVQYDHTLAKGEVETDYRAVIGGFVYGGRAVPDLEGQYVFGDLVTGILLHVPTEMLKEGAAVVPKRMTLLGRQGDAPVTLTQLSGASNGRADLRLGQDDGGELYAMSKESGVIYRLSAAN